MAARSPAALALLFGLCAARTAPALDWTPIVQTGDPAVGLPGDLTLETLGVVEVATDGDVLFAAGTQPGFYDPSVPRGLYRWDPESGPTLLFGYGTAPGLEIAVPIRTAVNHSGAWAVADWPQDVAPGCDPETSDARRERLLRSDGNGGYDVLAELGTPIPDAPDDLLYAGIARWPTAGLFEPTPHMGFAESGAIGFGAVLSADPCSTDLRKAILAVGAVTPLALVALEGELAPGAPDGMRFANFAMGPDSVNDAGQVAFFAALESDTESASAVYRWDPVAGLALVAMPDGPAPIGAASTRVWPVVSPSGAIAYFDGSDVWGPDGAGGVVRRVAVGDPVPGGPGKRRVPRGSDGPLGPFPKRAWINASDQVAFDAYMILPDDPDANGGRHDFVWAFDGLFVADPGAAVRLVATAIDPAPHSGGANFAGSFSVEQFGDAGEIAFVAALLRPTRAAPSLAFARGGDLPARRARPLVPAPARERSRRSPARATGGRAAGGACVAADFSQVAMSASVVEGEGAIFVAAVPEPASGGALVALFLLGAASHSGRRAS